MKYLDNICLNCGTPDLGPADELCVVCEEAKNLEELLILSEIMRRRSGRHLSPVTAAIGTRNHF